MRRTSVILLVLSLCPLAAVAQKADAWPQWRGPTGNGTAPGANPPVEWSDSKNIRWKVAIPGRGHATPIVWGDRVYIQTAIPTERVAQADPPAGLESPFPAPADAPLLAQDPPPRGERPQREGRERGRGGFGGRSEAPANVYEFSILALDRKTGETVWKRVLREQKPVAGVHPTATEASASPVTDGEHLYAFFGSYGLYCLDMNGNVVWEKDLGDMRTRNDFGEGASPALHGDTVVVNWDHEGEDFIVALDKKSGDEKWRTPRDESTSWATPYIVQAAGATQVIVPATNRIRSYDLATGKQIWECGGLTSNVIPSPVYADGVVYIMSGFRGNAAFAIDLAKAKGDISDSADALRWKYMQDAPYVPSPLLSGDGLYFFQSNRGVLTRLDAKTGKPTFGPQRLEGVQSVYASPVSASGHVYLASRDGIVLVIKDAKGFEVVASNKLDDEFNASPAIVGKEIYLRGAKHLYCIAE